MKKKMKRFDCVEMKRRSAARIYQETAGMNPEQEIEYWRRSSEDFRRQRTKANRSPGEKRAVRILISDR